MDRVRQGHFLLAEGCLMDSYLIRAELKRMGKGDLFKLTWQQKTGWCSVGARECAFLIKYKDFTFCLTELMGQRCLSTLETEDRQPLLPSVRTDIPDVLPHLVHFHSGKGNVL